MSRRCRANHWKRSDETLIDNRDSRVIIGSRRADELMGGDGNDLLIGRRGHDVLEGGDGNDILIGGHGKDTFLFNLSYHHNTVSAQGIDRIVDFNRGDTLLFRGNIHSLADLEQYVTVTQHWGRVSIKFDGGGQIIFNGIRKAAIDSLADFEHAVASHKTNIQFAYEYRTIDGSDNNQTHSEWGTPGTALLRMANADYGDGVATPAGSDRPSARVISNEIFSQSISRPNPFDAADMFWQWGQFLDHDIDLTPDASGESFPIAVPFGDPFFDPYNTGRQEIHLERSVGVDGSGLTSAREQVNQITAYIDASMIYGSDAERVQYLRGDDGKLKVSNDKYMPYNDGSQDNAGGSRTDLFVGGDIRANEQVGLTSMHILFVREHNRLVDELAQQHPEWDDEQLYQHAKMINEAQIQAITYHEFLPLLVGPSALSAYKGYDPSVNPTIANEFSTAAFRLGHTLLSTLILRTQENGDEIANDHLALRDGFFRPDLVTSDGIEPILRGLSQSPAESIDVALIDEVRNFLFGPPGAGGFDLVSLNIQRGRDHGLDDYNAVREAYGLNTVTRFDEITADPVLQSKLADLYGSVDNIDLFVGGLAEDPIDGSQLGELFYTIVVDQFERLRDGDRLWYENRLDDDLLNDINNTTLSDIILRNTDIEFLQQDAMIAFDRIGGNDDNNTLIGTEGRDLLIGFAGDDFLEGLHGDDELFGNSGNDTFVFEPGSGHDTIRDFNPSTLNNGEADKIDLSAFNTDFTAISIDQVNENVTITIDPVTTIELSNITATHFLTPEEFIF